MASRRALVTGASGMVGANLCRRLLADGWFVAILTRDPAASPRLTGIFESIEVRRGSAADADAVRAVVRAVRPDAVFHLATTPFNPPGTPARDHFSVNCGGLLNVLEAVAERPGARVIYTGSAAEYMPGALLREDAPLQPTSVFGASKAAAKLLLETVARDLQVQAIQLTLFTPFGPFERVSRLIPSTILSALKNEPIRIADGRPQRDFTYIDDVIDALVRAIDTPLPGPGARAFNICSGTGTPVREIVDRVLRLLGADSPVQEGSRPTRPDEIWVVSGDASRARQDLGWSPTTSLDAGLGRSIDWFRQHGDWAATFA